MKDTIKRLVARELGVSPSEIGDNTKLELDSLSTVELTFALEDEFDIGIADADLSQLDTINKIEKFIRAEKEKNHE